MSWRDHTLVFIQFRNQRKFRSKLKQGINDQKNKPVDLEDGRYYSQEMKTMHENNNDEDPEFQKISKAVPPEWMSVIDDVGFEMSKIKTKLKDLTKAHEQRLLPIIKSTEEEEEQTVEIMTENIQTLFRNAQEKTKRIGALKVKKQEENVKRNVQNYLALQLQNLANQFRIAQKDFLTKLQQKEKKGTGFVIISNDDPALSFNVQFNQQQVALVDNHLQNVDQRTQAIMHIAKSINDLAQIFQDMQTLVIEQGTLLDRIDYNVETASHQIEKANEELVKAKGHQDSYRKKLCMLILCICILLVLVVLMIKGMTGFHILPK